MKEAVKNLMNNVFAYPLHEFEHEVGNLCTEYGTEAVSQEIRNHYPKIWAWMGGR